MVNNTGLRARTSARIALISAAASGQGKTTVTAALARKMAKQGLRVRVFKTGPDFLDPMVLERASGSPVHWLDLWITGLEPCRRLLAQAALEADLVLIEGVMGLYDGTPSSADLARAFGVPVIAVIDASAMAQTAGALAMGLRDYGPVHLAGVIANRVASPGHAAMVASSLRTVPLLGSLPRQQQSLPERHLGLVQPSEVHDLDVTLDQLAEQLSLDSPAWAAMDQVHVDVPAAASPVELLLAGKTIAIARDAAFAFLYPANLDCLRALGATLCFFSPLRNEPVPSHADALYLPGGYPELHGATLAGAAVWQTSLRRAHADGLPIWAECGGMMVLASTLTDQEGRAWPMTGLLPGTVSMQPRLGGLGPQGMNTPHGLLRGHTFHYSRLDTTLGPVAYTVRHPSGDAGEAVYQVGSLTASYFHAYFPSCPGAVAALFAGTGAT
ncbi:cobyrinate a,c-diamide synthase [Noviherbaspirillum soli]|uniref:cobyrinate a,c-diamide synthase n=1 Tax=Noviherbaspirillum soli TaxID=1064518 RepID=UPI00188BB184|nr:cobyrinate a,c-diamide synthase [Noviherbaspirillum soli]